MYLSIFNAGRATLLPIVVTSSISENFLNKTLRLLNIQEYSKRPSSVNAMWEALLTKKVGTNNFVIYDLRLKIDPLVTLGKRRQQMTKRLDHVTDM